MKKQAFKISILFLFVIIQTVKAQFPVDEPYQSIAPPVTPAMPDYAQTVIDNSVTTPIEITRVTEVYNYTDDNGNPAVWYPTHSYSKEQVWNFDQTKYKIASWKIYNASTYVEEQSLSGMYPSFWSNTNPDLMWSFRENGDIKKYTISTNSTVTIANIPGYDVIKPGPGEGNMDIYDHYVALVGKKDKGNGIYDLDVIVFDLINETIVSTKTFPDGWSDGADYAPKYIDWVSVSQSGSYVVIMWNHNTATDEDNTYQENGFQHYGVEVYNTLDMQFQNRIIRYGNHGDLGYAVDGGEVLVQFYGEYGGGTLYMHKLDGSGASVLTTNTDFGGEGHVSCRNINRPGWAYVTISNSNQSGQIVAVKLDDSGIVEHFGHHFSSDTSYDQSAMAVASPDGDIICFKSDFGTAPDDGDVTYSFFAKVANAASINDKQINNVNCYPNPAHHFVRIESQDIIENITIFNQLGQKIKSIDYNQMIDISKLSKGMYFLNIKTDRGLTIKKIIKQ